MTNQQQQAFDAMREALERAKVEVSYMAGGMTHAAWKTQQAKDSLAVIDNALTAAKEVTAQGVEPDWRTEAAKWIRRKASEQQKINDEHPRHVECYPSWEKKVRDLNWLADDLEREQSEPPYGLEPWQVQQPAPAQRLSDE